MTETTTETIATVEIAGQSWPLQKLTIRHLRLLQGKLDPLVRRLVTEETPLDELSPDELSNLSFVCWVGISRARPNLSLDAFEELPGTRLELALGALAVARVAAGLPPVPPAPAASEPAAA